MTKAVKIEYTLTAKSTLSDIVFHLKTNNIAPMPIVETILDEFESKVSAFPTGSQISPQLLKIGCDSYRECNTKGGYRILYSTDGSVVTVHVILSQKQDIQQALFKRLIEI
ncbi:type II toxin-antitoxin system RelE/ParE family toxin [Serratia marcescens]|jgi:plasmid stabilization system protein ParE|nr:type II toxin-antitoxin system RelE/ParE family toxin [Serratia marcescens]MBN5203461.1 type II toxin-antitoxin system RelE/ParE family toxin [Serratia marcescens]HAT3796992.1 type II toxin-antitoxin system RelE/ParE family toxin [Serratia marcescens]